MQCCNERRLDIVKWEPVGAGVLAEFLPLRVDGYGNVQVIRGRESKQLLQPYLTGSRVHQVDAPDNVCNALQMIVDYNGELVGNQTISPQNNEIAGLRFEPLRLGSLQAIDKGQYLVVCSYPESGFICITAFAAGAWVNYAEGAARRRGQITPGAATRVGRPAVEKSLDSRIVSVTACALIAGWTIPLEAVGI